jgi:TRAP-type C4-dicarboxylate transport system substrate-binding protein
MNNYVLNRRVVLLLVGLFFLAGIGLAQAAEGPIQWRLSHWFMPKGYVGEGYTWFAKEVNKRTGGKLAIEVYPNGTLQFKDQEALSFLKRGNVDAANLGAGATAAEEPLIGFSELPFLFPTERESLYWIRWVYGPVLYPKMESKWQIKLLGEFRFPPVDIWAKFKISTLDDIKGKKLRGYGGVVEESMKAVGFSTFSIAVSELIPALQTGVVDSMVTTVVSASETKCWEAGIKYRNMPDMVRPMNWLGVSLKSFNALPKELQDVLIDVGRDFTNHMYLESIKIEEDFWRTLNKNGIQANPIPLETKLKMAEMVKPIWKRSADRAGDDAIKLLKDMDKY